MTLLQQINMNYININNIMDKVTRHPLLKDIPLETVVDYAVDFLKIVGMPPQFLEKTALISISEYRGELPCDFYEMIQVRPFSDTEGPDFNHAYRYSTDSFHMSNNKLDKEYHSDITYKLQGNCIFTSPLENGKVEIAYRAMPVDDNGYPLIPDNASLVRALTSYIKREWFSIQFDSGKINQAIMAKADQDYAWAVGQCQSDLIRPSIDQMEAITNMWNTLIDRADHRHGFLNTGTQEHVKTH